MNLYTETLGYGLCMAINQSDSLIACLLNSILKDSLYIYVPFICGLVLLSCHLMLQLCKAYNILPAYHLNLRVLGRAKSAYALLLVKFLCMAN